MLCLFSYTGHTGGDDRPGSLEQNLLVFTLVGMGVFVTIKPEHSSPELSPDTSSKPKMEKKINPDISLGLLSDFTVSLNVSYFQVLLC